VKVRKQLLLSGGMIGAMLAIAAWAYGRVPASLAVRWDIAGAPVGFADRGVALLILPLTAVVLTAVFALSPTLMPERSRLERSAAAWTAVWMVLSVWLLGAQVLMVAANLGVPLDVPRVCSLCAAGVIFVVGNWLGKVRYNFVFGIRTPWTLANERVWDKTHRFAGRLMVVAALVLAAAGVALPAGPQTSFILYATMLVCIAAPALAAAAYSALITRPS
jgi:uncharacterized membrane protein